MRARDLGRNPNKAPEDEPWFWLTRGMLESCAWRAMPLVARKAVERVMVEHMKHAGHDNGSLIVTTDDFVKYGIPRRSVPHALAVSEALGFLQITRGRLSYGTARQPNRFLLTMRPQ